MKAIFHPLAEGVCCTGAVMLMDEVITGYRWSSGGAQKAFGITPDLCIQAKIVAGGLPGGAVSGKREMPQGSEKRHL